MTQWPEIVKVGYGTEPDPAGSVSNWPPRSGSVNQAYAPRIRKKYLLIQIHNTAGKNGLHYNKSWRPEKGCQIEKLNSTILQ